MKEQCPIDSLPIILQHLIFLFHFEKSLVTYLVIAVLLSSSSLVTVKPGSLATWFRAGLQCTRTRGDEETSGGSEAYKFLSSPPLPLSLSQNRGLPRRWGWSVSHGVVWEEQQLALTFTQAGGNRDDRGEKHTDIQTHTARRERGTH